MASTVRKIDDLGRVVIPKTFRETFDLQTGDEIEFIPGQKGLYLQKSNKHIKCAVTGKETDDLKVYGGDLVLSKEGAMQLLEALKNDFH